MNTADSDEMAQPLRDRGFMATGRLHDADIVLMNTCTVREQAEHRADSNIGRLRSWKEKDPNRILIVAGCAASRWGDSIRRKYPFIDLVSPATQIEQFPEAIEKVLKERWNWSNETASAFDGATEGQSDGAKNVFSRSLRPSVSSSLFGDDRTAYVTIMRGCNYSCSYCIVPQVRGREVYRPIPQIIQEIRHKAIRGQKEVMLLGQTVNSYHARDNGQHHDFADLIHEVNAVEEVEQIRFMSPHPRYMQDNIIEAMKNCTKVARHVHLPVQSGSSRMLAQMKRLYSREEYLDILKKLRMVMPGILITTDIIVGFPGETDEDFGQTLSLLKEAQFNGLFAFKYSPRPGTASAGLADDVHDEVKEDRLQKVLSLNTEIKTAEQMTTS